MLLCSKKMKINKGNKEEWERKSIERRRWGDIERQRSTSEGRGQQGTDYTGKIVVGRKAVHVAVYRDCSSSIPKLDLSFTCHKHTHSTHGDGWMGGWIDGWRQIDRQIDKREMETDGGEEEGVGSFLNACWASVWP